MTIRNATGSTGRGTPRVPPAGGVAAQDAAFYQASATNTALTAGTVNLVAVNTAAYAEDFASSAWTFAAAGCTATYAGEAGRRFLITSIFTLIPTPFTAAIVSYSAAIAANGDVIGVDPSTIFAGGVQGDAKVGNIAISFSCQRLVAPSVGDVIQPCFALLQANDLTIGRHTLSILEQ